LVGKEQQEDGIPDDPVGLAIKKPISMSRESKSMLVSDDCRETRLILWFNNYDAENEYGEMLSVGMAATPCIRFYLKI
jgi:hypothetical protein